MKANIKELENININAIEQAVDRAILKFRAASSENHFSMINDRGNSMKDKKTFWQQPVDKNANPDVEALRQKRRDYFAKLFSQQESQSNEESKPDKQKRFHNEISGKEEEQDLTETKEPNSKISRTQ